MATRGRHPPYLTRMLKRYGFDEASTARTPLPQGFTADPTHRPDDQTGGSTSRSFDPAEIAGCLVFAAVLRPDLAFAASCLASAVGCWAPKHDRAAARVLRYIKGTLHRRIVFRRNAPLDLALWVDASFANDIHSPTAPGRAKSRSGCVLFFLGAVLWFALRRQTATAMSTCEAELAALCLGVRSLIVVRATVFVFRVELPPTRVYEDNAAVTRIFKRRSVGGRMRHIRVNISFTLDAIDADQMTLEQTPTRDQIANALTHSEGKIRHDSSIKALFLVAYPPAPQGGSVLPARDPRRSLPRCGGAPSQGTRTLFPSLSLTTIT